MLSTNRKSCSTCNYKMFIGTHWTNPPRQCEVCQVLDISNVANLIKQYIKQGGLTNKTSDAYTLDLRKRALALSQLKQNSNVFRNTIKRDNALRKLILKLNKPEPFVKQHKPFRVQLRYTGALVSGGLPSLGKRN